MLITQDLALNATKLCLFSAVILTSIVEMYPNKTNTLLVLGIILFLQCHIKEKKY